MPKIKLKRVDGISRKLVSDAYSSFMRHCQLKNLSPYSYLYHDPFFLDPNYAPFLFGFFRERQRECASIGNLFQKAICFQRINSILDFVVRSAVAACHS